MKEVVKHAIIDMLKSGEMRFNLEKDHDDNSVFLSIKVYNEGEEYSSNPIYEEGSKIYL